jgi:excisionase family DNA binding protein
VKDISLLTVEQAADRVGVSRQYIYDLIGDKEIQVVDIARKGARRVKLRIRTDHLEEFFERRTLSAA